MKAFYLYPFLSLTLTLAACSPQALQQPEIIPDSQTQPITSETTTSTSKTETLRFEYIPPQTLKTQDINLAELRYLQLSVAGENIPGSIPHKGEEFVPVSNESVTLFGCCCMNQKLRNRVTA